MCAADAVDHVLRVAGFAVAAPGDVLVGSDEHEVAFVEGAGVGVADVDDFEGHAAVGGSADRRVTGSAVSSIAIVPTVHVVDDTRVPPERVLQAACDFSERRADLWPDVHVEHLQVHERGEDFAVVTEGNPWPIGYVWERLRYDWSEPGVVKGTVVDSNIFKPGSTWELRATRINGGSRVEVIGVRHLCGMRGRLLYPSSPLGLAKQTVAAHLRHFLSALENSDPG